MTGAVALEQAGAADRQTARRCDPPAGGGGRPRARDRSELQLVAETGFSRVCSQNGSGRVAAMNGLGAVALAEDTRRVLAANGPELVQQLIHEVESATRNLRVATLLPRVSLICGCRILDLSDVSAARRRGRRRRALTSKATGWRRSRRRRHALRG